MSASAKQTRIGVGVFIWRNGEFLMGRRLGSHGAETWSLPGGHLEFGEHWSETAVREAVEETGLTVTNPRLVAVTSDHFEDDNKHYITIWVDTDWVSGEPTITEPDKWIDQTWQTFQTLPSPLFEPCWANLRVERPDLFNATKR